MQDTIPHQPDHSMDTVPSQRADDAAQATVSASTQPMQAITVRAATFAATIAGSVLPDTAQETRPLTPQQYSRARSSGLRRWLFGGILGLGGGLILIATITIATLMVIYSRGILPGISVAGIDVGGLSVEEATVALQTEWTQIIVRDGERQWTISPEELGLQLDARATAEDAHSRGRGSGGRFAALFGSVDVAPHVTIDEETLRAGLESLAERTGIPAKNAGVALVNGTVQAAPPENGRQINLSATITLLKSEGAQALASGTLDLPMVGVAPRVTDATSVLGEARQIVNNPVTVRVYDPFTGDSVYWTPAAEQLAGWMRVNSDPANPTGLSLTLDDQSIREFLVGQAYVLDETRYLKIDEAAQRVQQAILNHQEQTTLRVYHHDHRHTVEEGETIISIAWDYGVPYPWIQDANPGVERVSAGDTITIPSPDNFMPFDIVPDKRVIVSISQQRVWVYENGELIWNWLASTGIQDSPTWPGVYQIISHVPNAYASNWDLYMPYFMGVYYPIPGASFTNGFHGFPTSGGGQLLWEGNLGSRVTYGCIMLSNTSVAQLYNWAEEGVIVEIQP